MKTKIDWKAHIESWQQSGLKQTVYCRQHDLHPGTFSARLAEYRKSVKTAKPRTLVPVKVKDMEINVKPEQDVLLKLRYGNRACLECPGTVSVSWLAELLRCLG